ncbi:Na+/H+ antiporter [Methanosalsum zhilinae DSM 4017]|uniref:Na+/H+ antiporter n=1 Tax=Methanosalsum zhilinae (strain DSM 4017 / NBRC 107636 / OCM 62 / WeN5) TaxID=679901 RepID=F7XMW8_METZD|nr:hypothetical protein [Methanosalsum zhilinae]AEH59986.1 Na+/H+ antiporter [Methanosalsum zhilinae DSM 4017]
MDKIILENIKYLNDSVILILLLMPATLIIVFEAIASIHELRVLSIVTWVIYLMALGYVSFRVINLNKKLTIYMENMENK